MREALARLPAPESDNRLETRQGRRSPIGAIEAASEPTPDPVEGPEESTRRSRISELVARLQSGDVSAVDALRKLLDHPG